MNIAAKIVELSLRKHFASQKPTKSLLARNVTVHILEKSYLPPFHSARDHLHHPALQEVAAEPAVDFPEAGKFNGRVPFSRNYT